MSKTAYLSPLGIALVAILLPVFASAAFCPSLSRNLSQGMSGDDVSQLQQFFAQSPSIYPEGLVTGFYGPLTTAAVQRFQCQQNIVCSGDPASTGYGNVGPQTKTRIAAVCATWPLGGVSPTPLPAPPVGGAGITFDLPNAGDEYEKGDRLIIEWDSFNPQGSLTFELINTAGTRILNITTLNNGISGRYRWDIPRSSNTVPPGSYRIRAVMHTNVVLAVAESPTFRVVLPAGSSDLSVSPTSGKAPLFVTVSYEREACQAFTLEWDDGTNSNFTPPSNEDCDDDEKEETRSHIYTDTGSYTIAFQLDGASAETKTVTATEGGESSLPYEDGDRVSTTEKLNVRATASITGTLQGTQEKGAFGTVVNGPVITNDYTWWQIDWDKDPDGWSVEKYFENAPDATLTAEPASGKGPLTVSLKAAVTKPYFGGVTIDFGDGTSAIVCSAGSGCTKTLSHIYAKTGTYTATLRGAGEGSTKDIASVGVTVSDGACAALTLTHDLSVGVYDATTDGEVSKLQTFLSQDSSIYPEGLVTGFFGHATEAAVKRFQTARGVSPQSGFVGPITRAAIAAYCAGETGSISFSASPTSGKTPLAVTFTAEVPESTEAGVWFSVNTGENGKRVTMSADTNGKLSASHTYETAGTYEAKFNRNETLCDTGQAYVYGCTQELEWAKTTLTIEKGEDEDEDEVDGDGDGGGGDGSSGGGANGCPDPKQQGYISAQTTCGKVPFNFTLNVSNDVSRIGSWKYGISVPGLGRLLVPVPPEGYAVGICWYLTGAPGYIGNTSPDPQNNRCTLTLNEPGTFKLNLYQCANVPGVGLEYCVSPVEIGSIQITGTDGANTNTSTSTNTNTTGVPSTNILVPR